MDIWLAGSILGLVSLTVWVWWIEYRKPFTVFA